MSIQNHTPVTFLTTLLLGACPLGLMRAAQPTAPMEPLVVTADRSTGSILLGKELDLFQVDSVANLSGLVPNFSVVTSDTRGYGDILSMRGSANALFFSPPAVGMVVDDVPMGDTCSYPAGLLELDQVKVLRGPQGTIFGRNGAAGMLEMTTPQPTTGNETQVTADYGSYDAWGARLRTGGPLGAGFSQTLQLYHQERDGFIDNSTLGRATDDRSISGGLANLYWKPSPDTEWRLRVMAERADDGAQRLSRLDSPNPFTVESEIAGKSVMERQQVSLHWTKEANWGRLKSITAWQNWQLDPSITDLDLTASLPGFESSSTIIQDQRMWTQEFRWESPQDAAPWSWRTGVFFMNQASSGDAMRAFPVKMPPGVWVPYSERTLYDLDQWNLAAYGRASYAVNPRLSLQAGARVEYVDNKIDRTKTAASPVIPTSFLPAPSVVRDDQGAWYASPELGASYAWCDTTRLYARSALGIKPAGFSAFASTPATARYDEEVAWNNEVGMEVSLPDSHLTFSLAGFCNRSDNYQLNREAPDSTDFYTVNADRVLSLGLETELRWQPVAGLTLQGSAGYVNAEFDSAPFDGNAVPFVPEFTGSLGARYDFPKGFYVQTSLRMTGATYFNEANDERFRQGAYLCWDAELGYAVGNFSVALFGRNMLDEEYYSFVNPQIRAGSPGDPQLFGIRATIGF
ncbi:MAG: TonB-dependent receptor [Verrucomicrobia bacterium]|nr:TonB-dependent receptor [Verrucomicrobiota bacterium]